MRIFQVDQTEEYQLKIECNLEKSIFQKTTKRIRTLSAEVRTLFFWNKH